MTKHTTSVQTREFDKGIAVRAECDCGWHGFWGAPTDAREWAIDGATAEGKYHKREARRIEKYGR